MSAGGFELVSVLNTVALRASPPIRESLLLQVGHGNNSPKVLPVDKINKEVLLANETAGILSKKTKKNVRKKRILIVKIFF